ncbi:MAG: nucleotidyltransferase domain-containing protein [Campylobacterota bacterium]|nr:nucleotidyltransferase domain-containing protein [Campylobacterota bacterium]
MQKAEIIDILKSKKSMYHLKNFILFGSFARETNTIDSDIVIEVVKN